MASKSEKRTAITNEIDSRIYSLICAFIDSIEEDPESIKDYGLGYMRASYYQGYKDCMNDPQEERGRWFTDLGYEAI